MKTCPLCKQEKGESSFWKRQSYCIECSKIKQKTVWMSRSPEKRLEQHLRYKYGVTREEFNAAWDSQAGRCAICRSELPDLMTYDNRRRGYAIDHNHKTGKFRSILCLPCNSMLGMAKDSPDTLRQAADYLERLGFYGEKADMGEVVSVDNMRAARKKR